MAIYLGQLLLIASSDEPGSANAEPYFILHQRGFTTILHHCKTCVRSYHTISTLPVTLCESIGGVFSVALSLGFV